MTGQMPFVAALFATVHTFVKFISVFLGRLKFYYYFCNQRTVVLVVFFAGTVAIRFIGTHSEYDKIKDIKTI